MSNLDKPGGKKGVEKPKAQKSEQIRPKRNIFERVKLQLLLNRALRERRKRIEPLQPNPRVFIGKRRFPDDPERREIFDAKGVRWDLQKVNELEERWRRKEQKLPKEEQKYNEQGKKIADILEAILLDNAVEIFAPPEVKEEHRGKYVEAAPSSKSDDYRNQDDGHLRFFERPRREQEGGSSRGSLRAVVQLDVTYARQAGVENKFVKMLRGIANPRESLGTIKYFSNGKEFRSYERVPHVIIGLDYEHALDLARLWVRQEKLALANHPIAKSLVISMHEQLQAQLELAQENKKTEAVKSLLPAVQIFEQLRRDVRNLPFENTEFAMGEDRIFQSIMGCIRPKKLRQLYEKAKEKETAAEASRAKRAKKRGLFRKKQREDEDDEDE